MAIDLEKDLNPGQRNAAKIIDGPLLILAGAGAGKTRVLTYRIAWMIEHGIPETSIIALTFTNKAADEMKERVGRLLARSHNVWISTFHSACSRLLRENIDFLGYDPNFTIFDDTDSLALIKQVMKQLRISEKDIKPQSARSWISGAKNKNVRPHEFIGEEHGHQGERARKIYNLYQKELRNNNAVDFGDLLMLVLDLFENREILSSYQEKFKYILVDEYQDTNRVQYLFLKKLAGRGQNISVVGDEDQSIYGWRGADINNILDFSRHYKGVRVIKLEENYRSTQTILSAASEVVKKNRNRIGKSIWTSNGEGCRLVLLQADTDRKEAEYVVDEIRGLRKEKNVPYSEIAIFYRTNAQSRVFEECLRKNKMPYRIFGGLKFYDRAEIKDVIAYFRLLVNPCDRVSIRRVLALTAGIGKTTIEGVLSESAERNLSFFELVNSGEIRSVKASSVKKIEKFVSQMKQFKATSENYPLTLLFDEIVDFTGYLKALETQNTVEAGAKTENLKELRASLAEFESVSENPTLFNYLDQVSLLTDMDEYDRESSGSLLLMTLHMSKGLEFDAVFVVGMEEKLLPHARAEYNPAELEEERRLLYVGMTRAKEFLFLSNARVRDVYGRTLYGLPSRFLDEIPAKFIRPVIKEQVKNASLLFQTRPPFLRQKGSGMGENSIIYDNPGERYRRGTGVNHRCFGPGVIVEVQGQGENANVTVRFRSGTKKLRVKHAALEIL